jgi:hypothetical protein
MTDDDAPDLRNVKPYKWSDEQAIDFEVAQDTISLFIAACTSRYWDERRKDTPDPAVLEHWERERRAAAQASNSLRADDPTAIGTIIQAYALRLRDLEADPDG